MSKRPLLLATLSAALVLGALLLLGVNLPLWQWAQAAIGELRSGGGPAIAAFSLAHVAAIVFVIPVSPFVFAAGMVWGTVGGTALITLNNLIGTTIAFALAQRSLRPLVERHLGDHRHVKAIERAMALGGFPAIVLLRLSPIVPMSILNYGLGLFPLRTRTYVAATTVGLLPITLLYCWGAAGLGELTDAAVGELAGGPLQRGLFWLGLAATFGSVWWLQRLARRALQPTTERAST